MVGRLEEGIGAYVVSLTQRRNQYLLGGVARSHPLTLLFEGFLTIVDGRLVNI